MPRLFFAFDLPPRVSDSLDDLCEGIPHARWALDNEYHVTLSFLGEIAPHRLEHLMEAAHEVMAAPFEVELEGAGVFPHRGLPRVLWVGLKKNEPLLAMQRALDGALRRAGFELMRRKYHPHVTLARVEQCPREALAEWLARHLSYQAPAFKVFRFHLYSSILTGHGAHYAIERSWQLRP